MDFEYYRRFCLLNIDLVPLYGLHQAIVFLAHCGLLLLCHSLNYSFWFFGTHIPVFKENIPMLSYLLLLMYVPSKINVVILTLGTL